MDNGELNKYRDLLDKVIENLIDITFENVLKIS